VLVVGIMAASSQSIDATAIKRAFGEQGIELDDSQVEQCMEMQLCVADDRLLI
jgi:hypothetical protein